MANNKTVIGGSDNVSARQLKDFFRQIDEKLITGSNLQDFLEKIKKTWKVWRTIQINIAKNYTGILKILKENNCVIEEYAEFVLSYYSSTAKEETIQIVNISPADLGFKKETNYKSICKRARKFGLETCSLDLATMLRIEYKNQPENEHLVVAIDIIEDAFFTLYMENEVPILDAGNLKTIDTFSENQRFVFCLRSCS
jgi:hypothetical protein